jgi:hypothetical protein
VATESIIFLYDSAGTKLFVFSVFNQEDIEDSAVVDLL